MSDDLIAACLKAVGVTSLQKLRQQYPRWCVAEPNISSAVRASKDLIQEISDDLHYFQPKPQVPPHTVLEVRRDELGSFREVEAFTYGKWDEREQDMERCPVQIPLIHTAICCAMSYVSSRAIHSPAQTVEDWIDKLRQTLVGDDGRLSTVGSDLVLRHRMAHLKAFKAASSSDPRSVDKQERKAADARRDLETTWRHVGDLIDLFPSRRGGRLDLLSDDWLTEFAEQGEGLVKAVRAFKPTAPMKAAVRKLLLARPFPAGSAGIREAAKQRLKKGADEAATYKALEHEVRVDEWCARLAFPLLSGEEIRKIKATRQQWRWLVAERLGWTNDRLSKRLSKAR